MTHVLRVVNVNHALHEALWWLATAGVEEESRNGKVLVAPGPVVTEYSHPIERVLFCVERNANPFFHLMESIWMMAGRNDLLWLAQFNAGMAQYSDDGGKTQPAAYGHRWRNWFNQDQLPRLVELLKREPTGRRAVLQMWDADKDLGNALAGGKDTPCNTQCYLDLRGGVLNMTVLCRSNDAIWGAYGANAVHFSVLQEWLAAAVGVPMGVLRQYSHNLHVYESVAAPWGGARNLCNVWHNDDKYAPNQAVTAEGLQIVDPWTWLTECGAFVNSPHGPFTESFFRNVARPMYDAWSYYKAHEQVLTFEACAEIGAEDWREACWVWMGRAWAKRGAAKWV